MTARDVLSKTHLAVAFSLGFFVCIFLRWIFSSTQIQFVEQHPTLRVMVEPAREYVSRHTHETRTVVAKDASATTTTSITPGLVSIAPETATDIVTEIPAEEAPLVVQIEEIQDKTGGENDLVLYQTEKTYNGNLGGVSGANRKCDIDPNKPEGGAGYAVISGKGKTALDLYARARFAKKRRISSNGSKWIANDWEEIFRLKSALKEFGIKAPGCAWLGGKKKRCGEESEEGMDCQGWNSGERADSGYHVCSQTESFCANTSPLPCDTPARLLCVFVPL